MIMTFPNIVHIPAENLAYLNSSNLVYVRTSLSDNTVKAITPTFYCPLKHEINTTYMYVQKVVV